MSGHPPFTNSEPAASKAASFNREEQTDASYHSLGGGGAASLHITERQTPPRIDRPADQQDNLVIKIKIVPALHKHC
jgi:hypothetical protein